MSKNFDVVVIGAGPGGYVAAIRAAQKGLNVACVDAWKTDAGKPAPGGTCTNVGCIPSKALLQSSEHFDHANHHFSEHGISTGTVKMDVAQMQKRKETVVSQNNEGILYLFKKNKVTFLNGLAAFEKAVDGGFEIRVDGEKTETLVGKQVVIATGSNARALPNVPFDEEKILSNDGALRIKKVPKKLGVIGAGVIGLELGSVWRRLGAEVTVLEGLADFLPAADVAVAKEAQKVFTKQGLKIELGVKIGAVETTQGGVKITYSDAKGKEQKLEVEHLIVSIGRTANAVGLNLESVGVKIDERGVIEVDEECRTSVKGIWAVGDVVRGPMLAHKAEEEGVAVADRIAGHYGHVNYDAIPSVIYTSPEIAWVGRNEQQLKASGVEFKSGQFPFLANGRARALGDVTGFVKVLADKKTDEVLGVHIIGPMASELIAEAVMALEFKASAEDIARTCHAHPSLSESTKEAALAVDKRSINF